eukprot:15237029-Heterocapsa_arctica.AAC.1
MPAEDGIRHARAWINLANLYDEPRPMRGIDYMIARAAIDSRSDPHSPYGRFLVNCFQACKPDM